MDIVEEGAIRAIGRGFVIDVRESGTEQSVLESFPHQGARRCLLHTCNCMPDSWQENIND